MTQAAGPPRGPGAAGAEGLSALVSPPGRGAELPGGDAGVEVKRQVISLPSHPLPATYSTPLSRLLATYEIRCFLFKSNWVRSLPVPGMRLLRFKSFRALPSDIFLVSLFRKKLTQGHFQDQILHLKF